MKKRFVMLLTATFALIGLAACQNTGNSTREESSQEAHVHVFAEGTYPCESRICLSCGKTIAPTVSHDMQAGEVIAPTCEEAGYTVYTCSRCGTTEKRDTVAALGHDYVLKNETESTCSSVGVLTYECSRCGKLSYEYKARKAHTFDVSKDVVVAPTCTASGYTVHTCSVCGEKVYDDFLPATGHTAKADSDTVIAPTCTSQGYTDHVCSVCGEHFQDTYVAALGHDYQNPVTHEADCTHGAYESRTCSRCGQVGYFALDEAKHEHTYTNHTCSVCGESIETAQHFSYTQNGKQVLSLTSTTSGDTVVYAAADKANEIAVHLSLAEANALIDARVSTLKVFLGNPDNNARTFGYRFSQNDSYTYFHTDPATGYSNELIEIPLQSESGKRSSRLGDDGLTFYLIHANYDDGDTAAAKGDCFLLRTRVSKLYSYDDPSTWVKESETFTTYDADHGYKTTYLGTSGSYRFYIRSEVFAQKLEEGYKFFTINYYDPWDDEDIGEGHANQVNFDMWAYQKQEGSNPVLSRVQLAWIHIAGALESDGSYACTYDMVNGGFDYTYGDLQIDYSASDMNGHYIGKLYWKLTFSK